MKQEVPIITIKEYKKEKIHTQKNPLCSLAESMKFYWSKYRIRGKISKVLSFRAC